MTRLAWFVGLVAMLISIVVLKPREEIVALMSSWAIINGLVVAARCLFSPRKWQARLKFYGLAMANMVVIAMWFGWGMYISERLPPAFPWESLPILLKAIVCIVGTGVVLFFIFSFLALGAMHCCLLGESWESSDHL